MSVAEQTSLVGCTQPTQAGASANANRAASLASPGRWCGVDERLMEGT